MLSSLYYLFSSNKKKQTSDVKEFQKFCQNLNKEERKCQKTEQKNTLEIIKEMKVVEKDKGIKHQEKVFSWFSNLNLEVKKSICTLYDKCLITLFCQLLVIYTANFDKIFSSTEEMNILFGDDSKGVQNINASSNSKNDSIESKSKNVYKEVNTNKEETTIENNIFNDRKYFISNNREEPIKIDRKIIENDFLKQILFVSQDANTVTLSEEFLSNFEKFKKIFLLFSNGDCFKDWLVPKTKENIKYFLLPSWISKTKTNLDICQIFLGFLEINILSFYEYSFYTNRIYQNQSGTEIIKLYKEINDAIAPLNDNKKYINNIFTKEIIDDISSKVYLNGEFSSKIFNRLNESIKDIVNEKQKIKTLIKKLTFLNYEERNSEIVLFYKEYKAFILNILNNEIIKEMAEEDSKLKDCKKIKKNKNKKDKKKINKNEIKENNIQPKIKNENANNDKNLNKLKEQIKEDEEKKNKQYKEPFLYPNRNNKKEKNKKKKINKNKKSNNKFSINVQEENILHSNENLFRIFSKTSLSTLKSSNFQDISSFYDDNSSINEDYPIYTSYNDSLMSSSTNIIKINNTDNITKDNINDSLMNNQSNNNVQINQNDYLECYTSCPKKPEHMYQFIAKGINAYVLKTENNITILNEFKKNISLKLINEIIRPNLKNRYNLIFGFYGSSLTDTSIEGSDVDVCIIYKKLLRDSQNFENDFFEVLTGNEHNLKGLNYCTKNIIDENTKAIKRVVVKVDISELIKKCPLDNDFNYLEEEDINIIKIDFNFDENIQHLYDNMNNVFFVKNILDIYPIMRDAILIIKRYLKKIKMNEVFLGGISSFQVFLMVYYAVLKLKNEYPERNITKFDLLFRTFYIFSCYDFCKYRIEFDPKNNCCYDVIKNNNDKDRPFIINPLNGENIFKKSSCEGSNINEIFNIAYILLKDEFYLPKKYFNEGNRNTINKNRPIISITNLFVLIKPIEVPKPLHYNL